MKFTAQFNGTILMLETYLDEQCSYVLEELGMVGHDKSYIQRAF